jgi:hypothetical protein
MALALKNYSLALTQLFPPKKKRKKRKKKRKEKHGYHTGKVKRAVKVFWRNTTCNEMKGGDFCKNP